jgi:hypothetical protein
MRKRRNDTGAMYCVYEHWRPDKNVCFYVGMGRPKRAHDHTHDRNRHYLNVVAKLRRLGLEIEVRIFASGLTPDHAAIIEISRIMYYGRDALTNMTDGGDGAFNPSEETRRKIGLASRGRKGRAGYPASDETKARLREIGLLPQNKRRFRLYAALGPQASSRRVRCDDDGVIFDSASAAARNYGVAKSSVIMVCLRNRYRNTAGGRKFSYV